MEEEAWTKRGEMGKKQHSLSHMYMHSETETNTHIQTYLRVFRLLGIEMPRSLPSYCLSVCHLKKKIWRILSHFPMILLRLVHSLRAPNRAWKRKKTIYNRWLLNVDDDELLFPFSLFLSIFIFSKTV